MKINDFEIMRKTLVSDILSSSDDLESNVRMVKKLEDPYKNCFIDAPKEMIEVHETITTLINLRDQIYPESVLQFWDSMSQEAQVKFLANFVSNHYFYVSNRHNESFSIQQIDSIKSKVANLETEKILKLLINYKPDNFIFEFLDLIDKRFLLDDEILERMEYILAGSELLYYDMPKNRFENLKKEWMIPKEKIISKGAGNNEVLEELEFYIYCTFFRFVEKRKFEEIEKEIASKKTPKDLTSHNRKGHGELNKKLNKLWKSINEDNNI